MLRSTLCHLHNTAPGKMARANEDEYDPGGYSISGGVERCFRAFVVLKHNLLIVLSRKGYAEQSGQTDLATMVRSLHPDGTAE